MSSLIHDTSRWFVAAGQQPPEPTPSVEQVCLYTGLQLEEMAEKLELILGCDNTFVSAMKITAEAFKRKSVFTLSSVRDAMEAAPALLLDADADLIWVSLGSLRAMGSDPVAVYSTVAGANWAKFPGGIAVLDPNGKVVKPAGWTEPDHTPHIHPTLTGSTP